jgi:hypothetical protein
MITEANALKRYNSLFNNQQYSAIADRIAADLRVTRDAARVADMMNAITDTALSLCQHSHYADAWRRLAVLCAQNTVSIQTIDAIYTYLLIYQQSCDTRTEDFELTARALLNSYAAMDTLKAAVSCANGVHGWRGRMAYDLLAASDYLVQAAVQLLMHGDLSYIREKLQSALQRISGALQEGVRHSERPESLDLSATRFPTPPNRA